MNDPNHSHTGPTYVTPKKSGCLRFWWVALLLIVLLPVGSCIGLGGFAYYGLKAPIREAVRVINADPEISAALGGKSSDSFGLEMNDYKNNNGNGHAEFDFELTGPSQTARVSGKMNLTAGNWTPEDLTITTDDGTVFKLPRVVE